MILILYYKINNKLHQFKSKLHIAEYYVSSRFSEYKIFAKGKSLSITDEEYEVLNSSDFEICLANGVVLFTKDDVVLTNKEIKL